MFVITRAAEEKIRFRNSMRKLGGGSVAVILSTPYAQDALSLTIKGSYYRGNDLRAGHYNVICRRVNNDTYTANFSNNIYLSSVDLMDCLFDILFDKEGFIIIPKKHVFDSVLVKNKRPDEITGIDGYFSEVAFQSKTKYTSFILPCNAYNNIIS